MEVKLHIMADDHPEQVLELAQRREATKTSREILAVLNSSRPLNAILDYITSSAGRLLNADAVSVHCLNAETPLLTVQSSRGLRDETLAHSTISPGQAAAGQAVAEGRPFVISDVSAYKKKMRRLPRPEAVWWDTLSKHYQSILSAPMMNEQETVGALTLYYERPRIFEREEIAMAVAFCDQAALAIENARLREKSQEDAVAAERNRIARDLHDSVTQTLFSASLIAEVLPAVWRRDAADAGQSLEELRHLTRAALAEMRTLLLELRPAGLTEGRLEDLLRQLTEGVSGRLRAPLEVHMEGTAVLPPDVKLVFYRIAQEALNNLAKHSNAERGEVWLASLPPRKKRGKSTENPLPYSPSVNLLIRDDGCGFDPRTVTSEHMGLGIMRERALSVQAALVIHSKPGEGTEVSLTWPEPQGEKQR